MSRSAKWMQTELKRGTYYRYAETRFYEMLRDAGLVLADRLRTEGGGAEQLSAIDQLGYTMQTQLREVYQRVGRDFSETGFNELKGIRNLTTKATMDDFWEQSIVFYIERNRYPLITTVANTYKGVLNRAIQSGVEQGMGAVELARHMEKLVPGLARNRAIVIARTEVINASNMGAQFGAEASGVVNEKEWIATMDRRTREDHVEADAQVVPIDQPFILAGGNRLMWPGDNSFGADASTTIQCRCTEGFMKG